MFAVGLAIGLLAGWAVVFSTVLVAIALDAPADKPETVDEWGKPDWVGKEQK